jgi:hypothetical protein
MMLHSENDENSAAIFSEQHSCTNDRPIRWQILLLLERRSRSAALSSLLTLCYSRFFIVAAQLVIRCLQ